MAIILAIETSTKNCSVALFDSSRILAIKESDKQQYVHSEKLTLFIQEVIDMANISLNDLDAIAISKGPGSYTGLRIGTSTAKGLCYALDIPLISVSTLKSMAFGMSKNHLAKIYCPMIDARRDEVFAALFDANNKELRPVQADIVDKNTYQIFLNQKVLFFGDGALKCKEIILDENAIFIDQNIYPTAKDLGEIAEIKYQNEDFEDTAYFEPFYLKDFVLGKKN